MTGFVGKIEALTLKNKYFREVLFTGKHAQLVLMCLQPGEEIGNEVHKTVDQFFRIEEGRAKFVFNGKETTPCPRQRRGDRPGGDLPQCDQYFKDQSAQAVYCLLPP